MTNNEEPLFLVRTVNYTINGEGGYDIRDGDGHCSDRNPIRTRNFLVFPGCGFARDCYDNEEPIYNLVLGFEDRRLFNWDGHLYTISTVRQLNHEGWCEQVLASIDAASGCRYENLRKFFLRSAGMRRIGCRGSGTVILDLFIALARLLMLTVRLLSNIILDWTSVQLAEDRRLLRLMNGLTWQLYTKPDTFPVGLLAIISIVLLIFWLMVG